MIKINISEENNEKLYPINLNLKNKRILIVGAGKVALRKFEQLLPTGAQIKVVSPDYAQGFEDFFGRDKDQCKFIKRKFRAEDLAGIFMVFAAAANCELNKKIADLAQNNNILVNRVDNGKESDFTVPGVIKKGELLLTISTGSNLPALSKKIRKKLDKEFGLEYLFLLKVMKSKRREIIREIDDPLLRKKIFKSLAAADFLNKIKSIIFTIISEEEMAEYSAEKILENKIIYKKIEKEINKIKLSEVKKMQGMVQVYTGNGKGKTTAAFGLALRAVGADKKVYIAQFVKGMKYSELKSIEKIAGIKIKQYGLNCFINAKADEADIKAARRGLEETAEILKSGKYELVIMDEANIAVYYELFSSRELIEVIENRASGVEVVITGRYAADEIIEYADLVTEMKEIKHYYKKGVKARVGIEK